jgi:integrase/recombinase XerD
MRSRLISPQQRLIFEISLWTGERMGAITQLKVSDCYKNGKVLESITFASSTRKATKHGVAATRQVAVHPDLKYHLEKYTPPVTGWLFPSRALSGHITTSAVDKYWRSIFADFGLEGYSTHSSRRWVINQLRTSGIGIVTIAETMGMNIATVRHYLDDDPAECRRAIATLCVTR